MHDQYYENNPDLDIVEKELTILVRRLYEELDEEENQTTREFLEDVQKVLHQIHIVNN